MIDTKLFLTIGIASFLIASSATQAQTLLARTPSAGTIRNAERASVLDYQCEQVSQDRISCNFVVVELTKAMPADWRSNVEALRTDPAGVAEAAGNYCAGFAATINFFESGVIPDGVTNSEIFVSNLMREEDQARDLARRAERLCE